MRLLCMFRKQIVISQSNQTILYVSQTDCDITIESNCEIVLCQNEMRIFCEQLNPDYDYTKKVRVLCKILTIKHVDESIEHN